MLNSRNLRRVIAAAFVVITALPAVGTATSRREADAPDAVEPASNIDGLIIARSSYTAAVTLERLLTMAGQRGLTVFAQVDHAAGAEKIGQMLRPTTVVIVGNAKAGTPLMQCAQTIGIDLPLKVLVWQDANGVAWLGYNDPAWIARRHHADGCAAVGKVQKALKQLAADVLAK